MFACVRSGMNLKLSLNGSTSLGQGFSRTKVERMSGQSTAERRFWWMVKGQQRQRTDGTAGLNPTSTKHYSEQAVSGSITAVATKLTVVRDIAPRSAIHVYWCFGGTHRLHLQGSSQTRSRHQIVQDTRGLIAWSLLSLVGFLDYC
jgi:hypothetical protein